MMEIERIWGRPWRELLLDHSEAEYLAWYRVHLNPSGKKPSAGKRPKVGPGGEPMRGPPANQPQATIRQVQSGK